MHYVVKTEFSGGSGRLYQLNKNCTKKTDGVSSSLYRESADISMVSASGTLVKKLQTS